MRRYKGGPVQRLNRVAKRAANTARRENKALGLTYKTVEKNNIVQVLEDGTRIILGKAEFGTIDVAPGILVLKG